MQTVLQSYKDVVIRTSIPVRPFTIFTSPIRDYMTTSRGSFESCYNSDRPISSLTSLTQRMQFSAVVPSSWSSRKTWKLKKGIPWLLIRAVYLRTASLIRGKPAKTDSASIQDLTTLVVFLYTLYGIVLIQYRASALCY